MSRFSFDDADKKGLLTARAKTSAQRIPPSVPKHFFLKEKQASLAPVAGRSPRSSTPGESSRLRVRRSKKPDRLSLVLAFTTPPQKRRPSSPYGHKFITPVLEFANLSRVGPYESRHAVSGWESPAPSGGWKKDASRPERTTTMECTRAKAQNLKHRRFADSDPQRHPLGYETRQYLGDLAVPLEFKRNSKLLLALRDDDLDSHTSSLVAFLRLPFLTNEHQANLFFTIQKVKSLQEMVLARGARQYTKDHGLESRDEPAS